MAGYAMNDQLVINLDGPRLSHLTSKENSTAHSAIKNTLDNLSCGRKLTKDHAGHVQESKWNTAL